MESRKGFSIFDGIQIVYQNENKKCDSRGVDTVGIIICAESVSRYLKGEHHRKFRK